MHLSLPRAAYAALPVSALLSFALAHASQSSVPPSDPTPAVDNRTQVALYFGDVDGDGLDDVLSIDSKGAVKLLSNLGQGRYEDLTLASGLAALEGATCAVFADFDSDGAVDLFVGSSEKRLWRNLGNASFASVDSGIDHDLIDVAASAVDHDKDGLLDIQLHTESGDLLYRNLGQGRFERAALPGSDHPLPTTRIGSEAMESADAKDAQLDPSPARRRMQRWQRARNAGNLPRILSNSGTGNNGGGGISPLTACGHSVIDVVTFACLDASATPTIGRLYPLSTNLNVNAGGNVGIGTTTPAQKLDVVGNARASGTVTGSALVSTIATGTAPLNVASTTKVTSLNADLLDGIDSAAFSQLGSSIESSEITNGTIVMADIGQNGATNGQTLKWNGSAWAPAADASGPWSAGSGSTYVASGKVGIGTNAPGFTLDVQSPTSASLRMDSPSGVVQSLTQSGNGFDITSSTSNYAIGRHNIDWLFSLDYTSGNAWMNYNLGIGTTTATSKLTVAGTIESTSGGIKFPNGSVQTKAAAYGGTQYLTLGPGDFIPLDSNDRVVNSWYDGVWAYSGELIAPLHLPDGAQITSVRLIGFDTLPAVNLAVDIVDKLRAGLSSSSAFNHTYTAIGGYFDQTAATSPITVDNANLTRFIDVYPVGGNWPGTSALSFVSVVIEWSMP